MAAKKRGLGRGLDALLGDAHLDPPSAASQLQMFPVERLQPGRFQPRKDFNPTRLQELADSISIQGIVQPIVIRAVGEHYEIIAGERRWRAAQIAGLHEVPVVVRSISDQTALAMALIENLQREGLNPLEQAVALRRLLDEFDMTHQQAADAVGKSRTTVTNLLRLLDLQSQVKNLLEKSEIEMGHGRALLALPAAQQGQVAETVVARQLTVRATEKLVQALLSEKPPVLERSTDPNIERLQNDLGEKLGAQVQIKHTRSGQGQLIIRYASLDQLDGVLGRIH